MNRLTDLRCFVFIFIASLLIYIPYIHSFDEYHDCRKHITGDSWWYEQILISILEDGDLNMENNISKEAHPSGQLAMSKDGYLAPKHSVFFPIATIPFYLVFGSIGVMYFNLFLVICINLLIFAINRVFFNKEVSLITTFLFATGTIIMNYSYNYLGEVFSTVLLAWGFLYVIRKNYYWAALVLGLSCFAKVSNVVWVSLMLLYILWDFVKNRTDWKVKEEVWRSVGAYSSIILLFIIGLFPFFITNYLLYGGFITTGYHRVVFLDVDLNLILSNGASGFNQDLFSGLSNLLFHEKLGVLEANPIILVSLLGIFLIKKMTNIPVAMLALVIIIIQFLLFSKWDMWYATEFGNRFVMFSIVLLSLFTGNVINVLISRKYQ
jgi:hypothetical protein